MTQSAQTPFKEENYTKIYCQEYLVYVQKFIKRKQQRAYNEDLFKDAQTDPSTGKTRLKLTNVDLAAEKQALSVIVKVVDKATMAEIEVNQAWLDELPENDWKQIDQQLKELRGENDTEARSPKA